MSLVSLPPQKFARLPCLYYSLYGQIKHNDMACLPIVMKINDMIMYVYMYICMYVCMYVTLSFHVILVLFNDFFPTACRKLYGVEW
jgi:hypothetical protein